MKSLDDKYSRLSVSYCESALDVVHLRKSSKIQWIFIVGDGWKALIQGKTALHIDTGQVVLSVAFEPIRERFLNQLFSSFELIQQVHALQKRLIQKTEEIAGKEFTIAEKETVYIELREILARQPGPEAAEQLHEFQRSLKNKTKQLKRWDYIIDLILILMLF